MSPFNDPFMNLANPPFMNLTGPVRDIFSASGPIDDPLLVDHETEPRYIGRHRS